MTLSPRELGFLSNTDVLGFIQAEAERINARGKAEGWQFWTVPCITLADDFANVYEYMHSFACSDFSDGYKEVYGIRPRWVKTSEMSLEEVEALVKDLNEESEAMWKAEQEEREEQEKLEREEIALGVKPPTPLVVLEQWEIYEAAAEDAGYGAW
tara:strand:- start:4371 stop:4835 length:465 start_codon:yes stop_codon:yes gene_type:complete